MTSAVESIREVRHEPVIMVEKISNQILILVI